MDSNAETGSDTRVSLRQFRDVIARIIWRFDLPAGFDRTAEAMIMHAEFLAPSLGLLIQHAADYQPTDPGRLRIQASWEGSVRLDCGHQTILLAGPTVRDLSIALARRHGRATVVASNIGAASLSVKLP